MDHFISIIYKESIDQQDIAECLASTSSVLNENELEFVTAEHRGQKIIRMSLPESVDDVTEAAENLAIKLFELGLKEFEIELTERTLRRGDSGDDVKVLQQQLLDLGFDPNGVDGKFGPGTERALKAFQKRAGITVDGLAGGQTQAAISAEAAPRNAGRERQGGEWRNVEGTPGNPREVTRLVVGQLRDYVFDYTPENWRKLRRTHEAVKISDFGNRNNPTILMPRMPIQGQPLTNPDGPLYTNQGIRLDRKEPSADDEFIGRAQRAIDSADDPEVSTGTGQVTMDPDTGIITRYGDNETDRDTTRTFKNMEDYYAWIRAGKPSVWPQGESTMKIDDVVNEETYDGDEFHNAYGILWYNEDEELDEAEYRGRKVKLGKPMRGDVKKFKVYVKNPKGNVVKVNFGDPNMRIKKSSPGRRKSFRARHNCDNPGPRHKARYWSCRKW